MEELDAPVDAVGVCVGLGWFGLFPCFGFSRAPVVENGSVVALEEVGEAELDDFRVADAPAARVAEEDLWYAKVPPGCDPNALLARWAGGLDGVEKFAGDV